MHPNINVSASSSRNDITLQFSGSKQCERAEIKSSADDFKNDFLLEKSVILISLIKKCQRVKIKSLDIEVKFLNINITKLHPFEPYEFGGRLDVRRFQLERAILT